MKETKKQEIEELLSIIPRNYPIMDVYHLTNNCDGLCEALHDLCEGLGYHYDLMIESQIYFEQLKEDTRLKPRKFDFKKQRYNIESRTYDFVFVTIALSEIENISLFFKKIYAISKNAGKVLFIVKKDVNLRELEDTLIAHNYVATNPIEDTFSNHQILSAQKMHGWDN